MTEHGVAGRVVIVTGAGQGIGRGIALHLGGNGASVVVAEWKEHRATRTVEELTALGALPAVGTSIVRSPKPNPIMSKRT